MLHGCESLVQVVEVLVEGLSVLDELLEKQWILEDSLDGLEQQRVQVEGASCLLLDDAQAVLNKPLHLHHFLVLL